MKIRRWATVAASAAAASGILLLTGAGFASASIPGPDGTVNGCYAGTGSGQPLGTLRVIDSSTTCSEIGSTWHALNWAQTGPQGPAGPAGATGPQGPQGPAGTNWQFYSVSQNFTAAPGTETTETLSCDSGDIVTGGGFSTPSSSGNSLTPERSAPADSQNDDWGVAMYNSSGTAVDFSIYANCASSS